jgi:hypothetical protein
MGIELKLITADEAHEDSDRALYEQTGVHLAKSVELGCNANPKLLDVLKPSLNN